VLKCDFHIHTSDDPHDVLDYDGFDLVDRAAELGYQVLAITHHRHVHFPADLRDYARDHGILLISGVECRIEGVEVLLLGVDEGEFKRTKTFEDLRELRRVKGPEMLVIAPHPFYYLRKCAGRAIRRYPDLFDAIEFCHFYTTWCDRNRPAFALAEQLGKPMVACSDIHRLEALGPHHCLVDAQPTQADVFDAIRKGRLRNVSEPISSWRFIVNALWLVTVHDMRKVLRSLGLIAPAEKRSR
jgi:predicted metal-dependent phosphoesterase TrpH